MQIQNLSHIEVSEICNKLGITFPKKIKKVYGGNIHSSWKLETNDQQFFLKRNQRKKKFLGFEEYCLRDLQASINKEYLIVPRVIAYFESHEVELLLMEWIEMHNSNQEKLGKGLAKMHLKSHESIPRKFGYSVEGYIGTTTQIKGYEENWIDCFINLRIDPQLSILKNNILDKVTKIKIKEKIKSKLITHQPINALVHGDLWSGNVGIEQNGKGVIFDPACWWADCEVDIAMTKLFGGFEKEFYDEYHKIIPINEGFEERIFIYNFYHILNHANMFGGSYFYEIENYVKKIMAM